MNPDLKKTVTVNRGRFILGVFLSIAAFVVSFTVYNNLKAGLFFAFLFLLTGAVKISETAIPHRVLYVLYILWTIATAFVTLFLSQFCLNEWMPEKGLLLIILGMLLIIALFAIPALFTLRIRITSIIVSAVLILFTCVNYFVFVFRRSEIAPADMLLRSMPFLYRQRCFMRWFWQSSIILLATLCHLTKAIIKSKPASNMESQHVSALLPYGSAD